MSKVHAVLLVPAEGDPLGLLKEGPCGARPPTVTRYPLPGGPVWTNDPIRSRVTPGDNYLGIAGDTRALALAWDGEPVAEGLCRAGLGSPLKTEAFMFALAADPQALSALRRWSEGKGHTLILLDADSREIGGDR